MCINRSIEKTNDHDISQEKDNHCIDKDNKITPFHKNDKVDEDEDNCLICLERKSDVVLECYVSIYLIKHSYCELCIKSWLNNKRNTCPLCRKSINMNTFKFNTWDLLEDTSDSIDMISSINMKFYEILYKLITSNLKDEKRKKD